MNIIKIGDVYKASRITGPQHNYLGLVLSETVVQTMAIEPLSVDEHDHEGQIVDEQQLIDAVQRGVTKANKALGTQFCIKRLQYVLTDTLDPGVYEILAKQIVEHASMERHAKVQARTSSSDLP